MGGGCYTELQADLIGLARHSGLLPPEFQKRIGEENDEANSRSVGVGRVLSGGSAGSDGCEGSEDCSGNDD